MEKKLLKKLLVVLLIIMLLSTDFLVLGSNLISYAEELDSKTNNENIEFSAYFKDESGAKIDNISTSIKAENLKLYAEITVKNEGYFNGAIELVDSNFKIKNNVSSEYISSIEDNKVNLKQINAGNKVEIELDIEPVVLDTIPSDMLSKESSIKLVGEYKGTEYKVLSTKAADIQIETTKTVRANFEEDEETSAELTTNIITNNLFSIDGVEKRVVQLLVQSRLSDNQYPIKSTTINVDILKLSEQEPEQIKVLSLGTLATNGDANAKEQNWSKVNDKVQIVLSNEANESNQVQWLKNAYDKFVVTYIYNKDVDASTVEIITNSEIKVHNSGTTYTAKYTKGIKNKYPNGIITADTITNTSNLYKGQLYANKTSNQIKNITYNTNTTLTVTNKDIVDKIVIHEGPDSFTAGEEELDANTKYVKTEINKEKMLAMLGENASIQIKAGQTTHTISNNTDADENGNIIINYENEEIKELEITTNKPVTEGILEIKHVKEITDNTGKTKEQLKTINSLKIKNELTGKLGEAEVVKNSTETSIELKETITKAELTVNKESLSTMTTNTGVTLGIKLITDGPQYDLYKNPVIKIQLPSSVERISTETPSKLYAEGFTANVKYDEASKMFEIKLEGEQLDYPEEATQLYLQLNVNITLSKLAPSKTDKIIMTYTNENATQYEGGKSESGVVEKEITIMAPSGMVTMNNIEAKGIEGINGVSENKQLATVDKNTEGSSEVTFGIAIVNNTKQVANNVKILGKLPTTGEFTNGEETITNTLDTALKGTINSSNATVYYSDNMNATENVNDANSNWKTNRSEVTNPKAYLIVINTLEAEANFVASYTVTLPNTLDYNMTSYTGYKVFYNEDLSVSVDKTDSILVGITTGEGLSVDVNLSGRVGNDILNYGDTVKAGEVIKYTVTVKNKGKQTLRNFLVKAEVPEGTVVVVPEEDTPYTGFSYYVEKPEITEITEIVESLEAGQTYTKEYEVRVKMDVEDRTQISNNASVSKGMEISESGPFNNVLSTSDVRVTVKRVTDAEVELKPGMTIKYLVYLENLSSKTIEDVKVKLNMTGQEIIMLETENMYLKEDFPEEITIGNIEEDEIVGFTVLTEILNESNGGKVSIVANATDSTGTKYRSNYNEQYIKTVGGKITLSSPNAGQYVNIGDEIRYTMTVENSGSSAYSMSVRNEIPSELEIKEIYVNGVLIKQNSDIFNSDTFENPISNIYEKDFLIDSNGKLEILIVTQVKEIEEEFELKTITDSAKLLLDGKEIATSSEITHIIQGKSTEDMNNIISGIAWLDENQNGQRDSGEKLLSDIVVKLLNVSTNELAVDKDGKTVETRTNEKGEYSLTKLNNGQYIVLFEYDITKYEPTIYKKEGISENQNSNVVSKTVNINGTEKVYAVTDTINLTENISNINIGLKQIFTFDLELNKYISRIVVQNSKGTKAYEYKDSMFEKVEIPRKNIQGSIVIIEYTIRVKNTGEIAGYVTNIKDYLPSGLEFSSELNSDWYLSGTDLFTKSLANTRIEPGETKDVKLILTKTMKNDNVGRINNRAEIVESYNEYGQLDIDSTNNNQVNEEDDLGTADVLIGISTGVRIMIYTFLIMLNIGLIVVAIYLIFIKNRNIKLVERR